MALSLPESAPALFLVEDHPLMRQVLCRTLEEEGFEVIGVAVSAEDALVQLGELNPDLVLSDLSLPGESGATLVRRLQEARPELRCIIFSANDDPLVRTVALASGALDFVLKDDVDRLIEVVNQASSA